MGEGLEAERRTAMSYKLCKECGQPMLKKGQKRKHLNDYRHAAGCPKETKDDIRRRKTELARSVAERLSKKYFFGG
jgi:hypothetical protein